MVDVLTASVKIEGENIYEENSENKIVCDKLSMVEPKVKKEEEQQDTDDFPITPARVEKFDIGNFKHLDYHFLRNIQPGIMESNGTFKKMTDNKEDSRQEDLFNCEEITVRKFHGPFTFLPHSLN